MNSVASCIIKELYYESPQSITSLASKINKSIPLVTKEIQLLIANNLIIDNGLAPSNGGRRANLYALNEQILPYTLIIAIDQLNTHISLYDFSNHEIKAVKQISLRLNEKSDFVDLLINNLDQYLTDIDQDRIIAISITMPGFVNTELGLNMSYSIKDPRCQIRDVIQKKYNITTYIENDSTAIAIAEHKFGKAKAINDVLIINLNWGVGLGMIIGNKLFRGSSGLAGEFSHIPLSNLNKLCSCGKRGCLEVEASLEAAITNAISKIKQGDSSVLTNIYKKNNTLEINDLLEAAKKGDQLAIESFGSIGYALGKGIATLIHIINPQKIIISGFGTKIGQFLMPQVQSALLEYSIQRLSENTKIEISTLDNAQLIGTMATAVTHFEWKRILEKIKPNKL